MTVLRLRDSRLMLHSPCEISDRIKDALDVLGPTAYLVAPGTYHHLHIASAQAAFPAAETFICPGVERKCPGLKFDGLLGDTAPDGWRGEIDQVLLRGSRWIREVAFLHRDTRTLILVDLVENFTDRTPRTNLALKLWWKCVFRMWNNPKPAPEYQWGWRDRADPTKTDLDWFAPRPSPAAPPPLVSSFRPYRGQSNGLGSTLRRATWSVREYPSGHQS